MARKRCRTEHESPAQIHIRSEDWADGSWPGYASDIADEIVEDLSENSASHRRCSS